MGLLPEAEHPTLIYSCSEDRTVRIWDIRQASCIQAFGMTTVATSVTCMASHKFLLAADESGLIKVFDLGHRSPICELIPSPNTPIRSLCVSPDRNLLFASSETGVVYCWNYGSSDDGKIFRPRHKLTAHQSSALKSSLSVDGALLATASSDKTVRVWDTSTFEQLAELSGH